MSVDVSGVRRAFSGLLSAAEQVETTLKTVAHKRARLVHAAAQGRLPSRGETPHATGWTRAHLVIVDDSANHQFRVEVQDSTMREPMLPVWIEYGTIDTAARPFLRPAADENRAGYLRDLDAALTHLLEKAIS